MKPRTILSFGLILASGVLAAGAQPAEVRGTAKSPPVLRQAAANTRVKVADAACLAAVPTHRFW